MHPPYGYSVAKNFLECDCANFEIAHRKSTRPKAGAQKLLFTPFFLHKVVELIYRLNMPRSFTDDTAKIWGAEKLD